VIIPVLDSIRTLSCCLESVRIAIEAYGNAELILMDNGSTDGSCELMTRDYGASARVERMPGVTISALRNRGARLATGAYLSFIDADCLVPEDYLTCAMNVFAESGADAAGSDYELSPDPSWVERTWQTLHSRVRDGDVPYLCTGNLLVSREAFDRVGGFDESLVTGEDAEFGIRLTSAGGRIRHDRAIRAVHLGHPATLRGFFRQQCWHSNGMFGSLSTSWLDLPLIATVAHVACLALVAGALAFVDLSWDARALVSVAVASAVPATSVAYRCCRIGAVHQPVRSVLLYHIFFAARTYVFFLLLIRRPAGSGRRTRHAHARHAPWPTGPMAARLFFQRHRGEASDDRA
jgi:GT2 family glycosyltransferase